MELERYLEDGVQSTSFHSEEAEEGFATCLRWHSLLGIWLVEEPGAAALRPGPLHGTASTSGYRRNPRSNVYLHLALRVRKKKIWTKGLLLTSQKVWGGVQVDRGAGRRKGSWTRLWNLTEQGCFVAAPQVMCVSVLVFRIFPREYLLQQIHLYSLADLQQVGTQRGHFISLFSLGECLCLLWSWHWILPSLG